MSMLQQLQNKMKDTGNVARSELAQKLKTVFTVTAIEEAVRRTAQWAQQIEQTSKQLGISAEALQALQNIASKTGMPSDAVTGMFENIAKARDQAIAGNTELLASFSALGVSVSDLQTLTKSGLFGKTLQGIPQNIQNFDQFTRRNVANVTGGTPENFINGITQTLNGKSFGTTTGPNGEKPTGYIGEQVEQGNILSENKVSEIAATWTQILQTLKETATQLKPIAIIFLSVLNMLVNALSGIVQSITDVFSLFKGIATGDQDLINKSLGNIGGLLANAGVGLIKMVTGVFDMVLKAFLNQVPVIGHKLASKINTTGAVTDYYKEINKQLGISEKTQRQGEGLADVGTLLAGVGEVNIAEGIQSGAKLIQAGAEKTGIKSVFNGASKIDKSLDDVISGNRSILERPGSVFKPGSNERVFNPLTENFEDETFIKNQSRLGRPFGSRFLGSGLARFGGSTAALMSMGLLGVASQQNKIGGNKPVETSPILPLNALMMETGGGGKQSALSMGGVFGAGQSRMIKLNEQMVDYLAQITRYMSYNPNNPLTGTSNPNNPNTTPAGGM